MLDTQSTVNEQKCWNDGRERYDVRKNITFKMLQESRYNSNKDQVRECTHVVKILGRSIAFVISENVRCRGHTMYSTFHLQHTHTHTHTHRWRVTLQIRTWTRAQLQTKRSYIIWCKSVRGISSCYVEQAWRRQQAQFCNSVTKEAELRIMINWYEREHIGEKRKSTVSDIP
jgi:hypothetical protein